MKKLIIILLIVIFFVTGCVFDPYKKTSTPSDTIDEWFFFKDDDIDLGKIRRQLENIDKIKNKECIYIDNDDNSNYVYKCNIEYYPQGETVIPLSETKKIMVYVVITYHKDKTYNYIVYNSQSEDEVWKKDPNLNYGKVK